jgi:hypothetical protein
MKYLLYGIVRADPVAGCPGPDLCVVEARGLAAVVSEVEESDSAPGVSALLAYARAVEAIHARQAIVPLQYGCVMESEAAVLRLLEERGPEYAALLERLEGLTEMGIRVLRPAGAAIPARPARSPEAAYLESLRNRYRSTALAADEAQVADQMVERLGGWCIEQRREVSSSPQGRLVSLYFLMAKTGVEKFREEARQIAPPGGAKVLVSGPWPPYNFVEFPA